VIQNNRDKETHKLMIPYFKERRKEMKKNLYSFYIILAVVGLTIIFLFPVRGKTECDYGVACTGGSNTIRVMQPQETAVENAVLPGQPTLISPWGQTFDTTPTYTWTAVTDATWYHIWINTSTGTLGEKWYTAAEVGCPSGTGTCSLTAPNPLTPGTYTWWIQAWYNAYGPWSNPNTFYVDPSSKTFTMWINHLDFIPGDSTVTTSFDLNPNLGTGLLIGSTTTGIDQSVEKGLQVSPGFLISGVRVCYELSSSSSFINNISLARLQNPPTGLSLLLNDTTDLTNKGPICVDSKAASTPIDPSLGAVRLRLGVNFASDKDSIVVRAVGLHLVLDPNGPMEHTHTYLTGKGVGHNNTQAITSEPIFP